MHPGNPAQDLIPLAVAVRILYVYLHGVKRQLGHRVDRLNAFGYSLAASGTLYAVVGEYRLSRRLSPEELAIGFFRRAGMELHFLDGRPTLSDIAVTRQTLERAKRELAAERKARE